MYSPISILCIFSFILVLFFYFVVFYSLCKRKCQENMTVTIQVPENLPDVKSNIYVNNAYTVLKQGNGSNKVLYCNSDSLDYTKFVILKNHNFKEGKKKTIVLSNSEDAKYLFRDIIGLIPDFEIRYGEIKYANDLSILLKCDLDVNILYAVLSNKFSQIVKELKKLQINQIGVFDYINNIMDGQEKIKYILPFSKMCVFDANNELSVFKSSSSMYHVICFEELIYTKANPKTDFNKDIVGMLLDYYKNKYNSTDYKSLNLYRKLGYDVYEPFDSKDSNDLHDTTKNSKPPSIEVNPLKNIDLELVNTSRYLIKEFVVPSLFIDGIKMRKNDKVILTNQSSEFENGKYVVTELMNDSLKMINGVVVNWTDNDMKIVKVNNDDKEDVQIISIDKKNKDIEPLLNTIDQLYIHISGNVNMYGDFIGQNDKHVLFSMYNYEQRFAKNNYDYQCIGDPKPQTKEHCEHKFDLFGKEIDKNERNVWDRRCLSDAECPFFEKNNKSYRGGCNNGYCEMPLGVKALGFRKYESSINSYPFCQDCPKTDLKSMQRCCEKNKISKSSNKYVFTSK